VQKKNILIVGVVIVGLILVIRLFFLQILNKEYKINAENNALLYETRYPARGVIYDRTGKTLVGNRTTYDIMVTPMDIQPFDTLDFCQTFKVDYKIVRKKLRNYRINKRKIGYQTFTFIKQVSGADYSLFAEKAYKFPGFYAISRTARSYPFNAGANLFGYISEVDSAFLSKHPDYKRGDYVGVTGMEKSYEDVLRGKKGYNIFVRDSRNRIRSSFDNGKYDVEAVPGKDLISSIDGELQEYGELLMQNKVGSVVAIEPSTGEILAIVSSPGITIAQLSNMRKHYREIADDPYKPMFNRSAMAAYPPGSVFKIVNGLIGLQDGVITPASKFPCNGGYYFPGGKMGCHHHASPLDFKLAVCMSCNAYFAHVYRAIITNPKYNPISVAFNHWRDAVMRFGFGKKLGSDFPAELAGTLPTTKTYDKIHGKGRWNSFNILSLAIGQGEIGTTPLHLANLAAIIANRGYYYVPHLVKNAPDSLRAKAFSVRHYVGIDTMHFATAIEGMHLAANGGPGGTARIAHIDGIDLCGKTGTAQNPHGKDNASFICFAPRNHPKIAVAVYIENAGFGGTWAAPVASLMVEKYLNRTVKRKDLEEKIIKTNTKQFVPVRRKLIPGQYIVKTDSTGKKYYVRLINQANTKKHPANCKNGCNTKTVGRKK
jgi:penicillin-binding protein 2